jgi:uncharacterized membrane protein
MSELTSDDAMTPSHRPRRKPQRLFLGVAACALSTAVGLISLRYVAPSRPAPAPIPNASAHPLALALHAVPAALALIIMPLQLHAGFRTRHPRAHRVIGRTYAGLVGVASLAALRIAPMALGGPVSAAGFTALALAWVASTALGARAAMRRRFDVHRGWMTRSAALTFAAVTLRLLLPLSTRVMGFDFVTAYRAIAWLCWLPNLLVAEWWLRRDAGKPRRAGH